MGVSDILLRSLIGVFVVSAILMAAYIAKFLLFPAVVVVIILVVSFFIGDWIMYFMDNKEEIIEKFKEALK